MAIEELRLLPPLAIGRLGEASVPLEAFDLELSPAHPLDYRQIVPKTTLVVDERSGKIVHSYTPKGRIRFKDDKKKIFPVAPFLEVYARTSESPDELVPLTVGLLKKDGLDIKDLQWQVEVANIKIFRRTTNPSDKIIAGVSLVKEHSRIPLMGRCENFLPGKILPLGWVQFIKPTPDFPQIRLRFTPAAGKVYGSQLRRKTSATTDEDDPVINDPELVLYDEVKGDWTRYVESGGPSLTNPGQIFAGYGDDDGWHSWGYIDDECDGFARVILSLADGRKLSAQSHIGAGPPTFAPDTLPIRVVSDELEQILFGNSVKEDAVPIEEAEEIVRRALETIRLLNTAVMNGNPVNGRLRPASTMVSQDSNDFERYYEPIAAASLVDNLALRSLHERVFTALSAGRAPWFSEVLRRPEEIGDLSSRGRRKMPAMMRGSDARALTLTRRQIDIVIKAASQAMFESGNDDPTQGEMHS